MLLTIIKYLQGYVKIKVEGYSPERFLNLCNVHGILIWGVESKESAYELYVLVKDYKKIRPLVKKTRTRVELLEKHGFPFFLYKFRKRKIFFAGMLFTVIAVYSLSLFVWNIHFEGNVSQNTKELLEYLATTGVTHGTRKSKIICEDIEKNLRTRYPEMIWVSAEMRGTRIIIQIKENSDKDIVSEYKKEIIEPYSLAADVSGVIDSMIVRRGTALVQAGDFVEKGQILVQGAYEVKNDAGEIVRYEKVPADAEIMILTTEDYKDSFSMEYTIKEYTERKRLCLYLQMGKKRYEASCKIPFSKYETVKQIKKIHITENFYLPFTVETVWYLEYVEKKKLYDENEAKKTAEKRFYDKYENILQKGVQIIEKDVRIDTNGKLCHVTGKVCFRVRAEKEVPVNIPELKIDASLEGEN